MVKRPKKHVRKVIAKVKRKIGNRSLCRCQSCGSEQREYKWELIDKASPARCIACGGQLETVARLKMMKRSEKKATPEPQTTKRTWQEIKSLNTGETK